MGQLVKDSENSGLALSLAVDAEGAVNSLFLTGAREQIMAL